MTTTAPGPIETFANAAARDLTIVHPTIGQGAFMLDTGALLFWYGNVLGWLAPWNGPWGEQARTRWVGATPAINDNGEHEITGLATSLTAVAGRRYRLTLMGNFMNNDTLNQAQGIIIFYDDQTPIEPGALSSGQLFPLPLGIGAGAPQDVEVIMSVETTFTTGVHRLRVTRQSQDTSAGGTQDDGVVRATTLTVDDMGPAANPIYR